MAMGFDTGAQSASFEVIWKAKGGDLGGPALVGGVSRSIESIFLCLRDYFDGVPGLMVEVLSTGAEMENRVGFLWRIDSDVDSKRRRREMCGSFATWTFARDDRFLVQVERCESLFCWV
jgi:hypothetical protein